MIAEAIFFMFLLALTVTPFLCDVLIAQYLIYRLLGGRNTVRLPGVRLLIKSSPTRSNNVYITERD